jgi:hypothetical protein
VLPKLFQFSSLLAFLYQIQEVQDEYITRSSSFPVNSGYIENPDHFLKALRCHLLNIVGRVMEHGQSLFLKVARHHPSFLLYKEDREKLLAFFSL